MKNDDDVLETALNFGIASSARRYGITEEVVRVIVIEFKKEIDDYDIDGLCPCDRAKVNGIVCMCSRCEGPDKRGRILM